VNFFELLCSHRRTNLFSSEEITDFTLSHYNERAEDFWEGTRDQ
jgi:hypothetical protein